MDDLLRRAHEVLGRDPRVVEVRVAGSRADGTDDEWSDLDLAVVATADGFESLLAEWPEWLAAITPTVFARTPIAPFVINAVTADGRGLDVVVHRGALIDVSAPPAYTVGLLAGVRFPDVGAALEYAVAEQLRGMCGPFVTLLQRDEHVRHMTAVAHLLGLLTTVFVAESGSPPLGKRWNESLTEEQRSAVAALPPLLATREDLMAFGLALGELLVGRARPLYPRYGLEWPAALAAVTARRLHDALGVDTTRWLS